MRQGSTERAGTRFGEGLTVSASRVVFPAPLAETLDLLATSDTDPKGAAALLSHAQASADSETHPPRRYAPVSAPWQRTCPCPAR